jgi:dodecin
MSLASLWGSRFAQGIGDGHERRHRAPAFRRLLILLVTRGTSPVGLSPGGQFIRIGQEVRVSVYRVTDLIGTSTQSWEDAASEAIKAASGTLRDLRVAEVVAQDIHLAEDGGITYRTKLRVSFKYEPGK